MKLQSRVTGSIILPILLVLIASDWFLFYVASKALDAEMGGKLIAIASASASQIKGEYLRVLQPGSEGTRLYQSIKRELLSLCDATGAKEIFIFDFKGRSLVDSRDTIPIGSYYRALGVDRFHINQAKKGVPSVSTAFHGKNDAFYKSAYAPVRDKEGNIVAIIAVDASALFLETLENMRRNMIITGIIGVLAAVILSVLLARSISTPVKRLSKAAQRIKEGNFGIQVEIKSRDEIGTLANIFNQMSLAIQSRNHRLRRLNEELKQMSAGLAHEVRNPLNGMRIFLGLLKRRLVGDAEAEDMLEKTDREVRSLNKIVTEFLEFARPTAPKWESVNLSELVSSTILLLHAEFEGSEIQVQTAGLEALPPIMADEEQLKQAFMNVVLNAVQAMPMGGALTISGNLAPDGKTVRIAFADTGDGIPQDVLERIFDPFFTTKDMGTGLGLAVVKRLVENHSGEIECSSEVGKGTIFTITLPVKNDELDINRR